MNRCDSIPKGAAVSMRPWPGNEMRNGNGEHVSADRPETVHQSDQPQETLPDETDARPFVRMQSPFSRVAP